MFNIPIYTIYSLLGMYVCGMCGHWGIYGYMWAVDFGCVMARIFNVQALKYSKQHHEYIHGA